MTKKWIVLILLLLTIPGLCQEKFKESEIQLKVGPDTFYGTFTVPASGSGPFPAVLLFSGSGPTDRDGNSSLVPGKVDSHLIIAHALAESGIASLRYDKLFSGKTGVATHAKNASSYGYDDQVRVAQAAFDDLKARPEVDPKRLGLLGHSEGGLTALVLAQTNQPAAVALVAPMSKGYLTTIAGQVNAQYDRAAVAGSMSGPEARAGKDELAAILAELKSKGTVPAKMRPELKPLFAPVNLHFLHSVSAYEPGELLAKLPASMPVLLLAGERDIQVLPADVEALAKAGNRPFTVIAKTNHVLKYVEKPSANPLEDYGNVKLPFAEEARKSILGFFTSSFGL